MASSSPQNPIFPLEIFHLILKDVSYVELFENDIILNTNDLRRCSLVCRAWAPICQAYLFKSARLDSRPWTSGPGKGIIAAISAHPKIASYVRKIFYSIMVRDQDHNPDGSDQYVSTLLMLPNLQSIYVYTTTESFPASVSCNFNRLCAVDFVFSRLWEAYISSTSLVDLGLESIDDVPLATFLSCPNLTSLALTSCGCTDWQPQPASTTTQRTSKIESLELWGVENISYSFLGFLPHLKELFARDVRWQIASTSRDLCISTFRGLQKLTFDYGWAHDPHLWVYFPLSTATEMGVKLFEHCQELTVMPKSEQEAEEIHQALRHTPSIDYLDVNLTNSSSISYLNLHRFLPQSIGNLKTIHIRFGISNAEEYQCRDTVEVISESLSLVPCPASLEELAMTVKLEARHLLKIFNLIRQLKMLDTALFVDSSMFPLLTRITFHICVEYSGPGYRSPELDDETKRDLYECIESSFQAFKRSPRSRLNIKLWIDKQLDD